MTARRRSHHELEETLETERTARRAAEELAEQIADQAAYLQEQAAEIEVLNDEIAASRARLQATINSSLDAIVTTDRASVILEWNRPAEVIFGWTAEEAIGRELSDTIIPPQYREGHRRGVEHYLASGEGPILNRRIEITALRRDGTEFPVELTVAPAGAGTHLVFNAFIRDLTDSKRLERQRTAEHALTRVLAESRTLEEAAPRILQTIGQSLAWDVGGFWLLDRRGALLRPLAFWNAAGPEPAFVRASRDLTFEKGSGLPGRVWEDEAPVWIEDVQEDDNFPRATAAAREGLHGAFAFPVIAGDEFRGVIEFFYRQPLRPDAPLLQTVVVIGTDIAQSIQRLEAEGERNRAIHEIERLNEDLRQANSALAQRTVEAESASRAKSDFLANMSHELRTPINAIIGYGELLQLGITGPITPEQSAHLERIAVSSRHLLALIEDILDLSKIEAGHLEVAHEHGAITEVVNAAISLLQPQAAQKGLTLTDVCGPEAELSFVGDPDRARQILANLLSNAVKFTEPGGSITVSCVVRTEKEHGAEPGGSGPWLVVGVRDSGVGIAAAQLEAIFDPFTQVETNRTRSKGGTGLGLSISRQLARLMAGDVTVRSEAGKGSCFELWLPIS